MQIKFDIVRKSEIDKTYRVAKVVSDFDLKIEDSKERFEGEIKIPEHWNIGVIVGNSGTGKSTIAKDLFNESYIKCFKYLNKSVIDDMPKECSVKEITKMFYSVGFGSVPSWIKPYKVLSNGEKMRVDLARALLQQDTICFDEFTSVVDRRVAETMCIATQKVIRKQNKKFIAVSCHYDILNWLQPDWVFDTNEMKMLFMIARDKKNISMSENAGENNGKNLANIII